MARKPFHRASFEDLNISPYQAALVRECEICKCQYTIDAHEPWEWAGGVTSFANLECCEHWCLACTLGVGPTDFPESYPEEESAAELDPTDEAAVAEQARGNIAALQIGPRYEEWADDRTDEVYAAQCRGDILKAYSFFTDQGIPLIIMPLTRAISDRSVHYPNGITYYPPGTANFDGLDHLDEVADPDDRSIRLSEYAGANLDNLRQHALLVFPAALDPQLIAKADHDVHLDLIRRLSEEVDKVCLNFVRYYSCKLEKPHAIPARAGQTQSDPAMSICLVYDPEKKSSRLYGGSAFPFAFTGGVGIWLRQPEWQRFPGEGEVGKIVYHALTLYATMLESSSDTNRFIQALSLLEFLAFPSDYAKMVEVKKVIARYVATDQASYNSVLERFRELTANKDPVSKIESGLRTRVIHIGDRIESLIPNPKDRRKLFVELDGYIRPVIDHMILHSELGFDEYSEIRKTFPAFLQQTLPS
jgi:hypothetical protein